MRPEQVSSGGESGQSASPAAATLLFADLVGYTALTEHHGDDLAADVSVALEELAREEAGSAAAVLKTMGDAVMLRVDDPGDAVLLALRLCARVCSRDNWPQLALGIAHGPVVLRGTEYLGATVNRASRICAFARAGEVLLDQATFEAARRLTGVRWIDVGDVTLRNLAQPIRLHRATSDAVRSEATLVDPVCRMSVRREHAVILEHDGRSIGFCSGECAGKFIVGPDRYEIHESSDAP